VNYLIYDTASGQVLRSVSCIEDHIEIQCGAGEAYLEHDPVDNSLHQVINGEIVARTPPLVERQAALWELVKSLRDEHIDGGYAGFDTDLVSRTNLTGAALGATLDPTLTIQWKMADNSVVTLDASQIVAAAKAVLGFVSACHARSQALGEAIMAATDQATLDAIDVTSGWPA
jgi:hypothetical protein